MRVLVLLTFTACSSRYYVRPDHLQHAYQARLPAPEPQAVTQPQTVADEIDRCSDVYPQDCFADEDGCPDPPPVTLGFVSGSKEVSAEGVIVLRLAARESARLGSAVRVRVVGGAGVGEAAGLGLERANEVRRILIAEGMAEAILVAEAGTEVAPSVGLVFEGCQGDVG